MVTWVCPTCSHVEHQPEFVNAVGHACPQRRRDDRQVSTFQRVTVAR